MKNISDFKTQSIQSGETQTYPPGLSDNGEENSQKSLEVVSGNSAADPKLTKETQQKICDYIRRGLTWEKAGEILGINPSTMKSWTQRHETFASAIKKARRELEVNLLESINQAGEKSWQARAWMLERSFGYTQAPARVDVRQEIQHGLSPSLAQILAGYNSKNPQAIEPKEVRQIETEVIDVQDVNPSKYTNHCATNAQPQEPAVVPEKRKRHKPMRRKKLARGHDTPTGSPQPPEKNVNTP
jgi:hypothetical protein